MRRLNLGCGRDYRQGWVNVDADRDNPADVYCDVRKKFPFEEQSFDYILAQDILEHLTKGDAKKFLAECGRVLSRGGRIRIRTPNILQIIKQFKSDPSVMIKFIYGEGSENSDLGLHKHAHTAGELKKLLVSNGFGLVNVKGETTNFIAEGKKRENPPRSIKVLISLQDSGGLGGAESFLLNLASSLKKRSVVVEFSTWTGSRVSRLVQDKEFITRKIPVRMDVIGGIKGLIKFFLFLPLGLFVEYRILNSFKRGDGRVILLSGISDKIVLTPLAKILGLGVIWIEFAPLAPVFARNGQVPKLLYRLVKGLPDKVVVPTLHTKTRLIPETRISEAKMEIIPCGIRINNERLKAGGVKLRRSKTKIIGMISRTEDGKGQDLLISAIHKLKIKEFGVVIIGEGETKNLVRLAKKLGVSPKVEFLGYVDDAQSYLRSFDVFVFPSTWELEGFGLVLTEAMDAQVPIVAVDFGPIAEVVGRPLVW